MYDVVKMLKAIADGNRFRIFNLLMDNGETCACELLKDFNISQPTLSRHMKVMVDSGLIVARKDAQWMKYSVNPDALKELRDALSGTVPGDVPVMRKAN